jgi:hypothetical protein
MACSTIRRISGKTQTVWLSPDDLDQLLDALDSLHQPLRSQDMHDELRHRLSVAYDESQA